MSSIILGEYKNLEIKESHIEITEDEITEEIQHELIKYAEFPTVNERGVEKGDIVYINYISKYDDTILEDNSKNDIDLIVGDEIYYLDFENSLLDMPLLIIL